MQMVSGVTGNWTGTWWAHAPTEERQCQSLDCSVVSNDGKWQATFLAQCDRSYRFTITMEGRQAGKVVLFLGSTDLGEQGGVFDWIGRASEADFVGFFTSSHYVGEFHLTRKP